MALGPGIYDDECTEAREATKAQTVLLMVMGGAKGNGFSVQSTDALVQVKLPAILRSIADQIEGTFNGKQSDS